MENNRDWRIETGSSEIIGECELTQLSVGDSHGKLVAEE
jgi:hypothetical protein